MFEVLHSDINSHKSSILHLTGQPYWKKSRSAKVKDGIINLFLRNNLIDPQMRHSFSFNLIYFNFSQFQWWRRHTKWETKGRHAKAKPGICGAKICLADTVKHFSTVCHRLLMTSDFVVSGTISISMWLVAKEKCPSYWSQQNLCPIAQHASLSVADGKMTILISE